MRPTPYNTRQSIIAKLNSGKTEREIETEFGVNRSIIGRLARSHNIERSNKAGRKQEIDVVLGRYIARSFYIGKFSTAVEAERVLRELDYNISAQTIRRFLKSFDFNSQFRPSALPLTTERKKTRLKWAKKYKAWTKEDWLRVVFSDETKINRLGSDGKQWTWVKKGESLRAHNVNFKYKGNGGSLIVWSCITRMGPGYIAKIDGGMDSKLYCDIIGSDFLETLKDYEMDSEDVILQHDNDPKHTSAHTTNWLQKQEIKVLDWPSYSPDLNPIENLWYYLKCRLAIYKRAPKNIGELWERVADVWYNEVTKEICIKHIESMPDRIKAVIKAKGGSTKW